jgi:YVTN family beta-propeller protein
MFYQVFDKSSGEMKNNYVFLLFAAIALFAISSSVHAQSTFGIISCSSCQPGGLKSTIVATQYVLPVNAIVTNISVYAESSGNEYAGIYSNNSGNPGNLLVSSASTAVIAGQYNLFSIKPTYLTAGTYWITTRESASYMRGYLPSGNATQTAYIYAAGYGALPKSFAINTIHNQNNYYVAYASYDPQIVIATPTITSPIDLSQSVSLSSNATGGTGTLTGQWYRSLSNTNASGTPVTGGAGFISTDKPTNSGTVYYYLKVSDGITSAKTRAFPVTVNTAPVILINPNRQVFESGQQINFTISDKGGTGPFNAELYNVTGGAQEGSNVIIKTPGSSNSLSFQALASKQTILMYRGLEYDEGTATPYFNESSPIVDTITGIVTQPIDIAVNPSGTLAYVLSWTASKISVVNLTTNSVINTINVPTTGTNLQSTVAFTPDGTLAYVVNYNKDSVNVIDVATGTVIKNINLNTAGTKNVQAWDVAFSPSGSTAYVSSAGSSLSANLLNVINVSTNTITNKINIADAYAVAVSPSGNLIYAVVGNSILVISPKTDTAINKINMGPSVVNSEGVTFNPSGTLAYVSHYDFAFPPYAPANTISVINVAENKTVNTITVGNTPIGIVFNPSGTLAYVANYNSNSISVIDVANNTTVNTIQVGAYPRHLAINPSGSMVYVNSGSAKNPNIGVVDVINTGYIIVVNPALAASLNASPSTIDEGQNTTLTATASGGSGTYTYTFTDTNNDTLSSCTVTTTSTTATCKDAPNSTDNYTVSISDGVASTSASTTVEVLSSTTDTIGANSTLTSYSWSPGGMVFSGLINATSSGKLQSIGVDFQSAGNGAFRVAIYSDDNGSTGTLLAQSASVTTPLSGWEDLPVNGVNITAGTSYFLAEQFNSSADLWYYTNGTGNVLIPYSYGSFPTNASWSTNPEIIEARMTYAGIPTTTSVSCTPSTINTTTQSNCTATLTGGVPNGETVKFNTSDLTGTFSSTTCALVSQMCNVTYSDTAASTPKITATYTGDGTYAGSSGSTLLTVNPVSITPNDTITSVTNTTTNSTTNSTTTVNATTINTTTTIPVVITNQTNTTTSNVTTTIPNEINSTTTIPVVITNQTNTTTTIPVVITNSTTNSTTTVNTTTTIPLVIANATNTTTTIPVVTNNTS